MTRPHILLALLPLLGCGADSTAPEVVLAPPLDGWAITQAFGVWNQAAGGYHLGVDLDALPGTPVRVMANGVVTAVLINDAGLGTGWLAIRDTVVTYGAAVVVEHTLRGEGVTSVYAHLSSQVAPSVAPGDSVTAGDVIGVVAWDHEDGVGGPPRVHFGVRLGGGDPEPDPDSCNVWHFLPYSRECAGVTGDDMRSAWRDPPEFIAAGGRTPAPGASR